MVSADAGPRCCELIVRNLGLYKNIINDVVVLQNALDAVALREAHKRGISFFSRDPMERS